MNANQFASPKPIVVLEGVLLFSDTDIEKRINHKVLSILLKKSTI